jgi:mRNA interferase RelE/StbE
LILDIRYSKQAVKFLQKQDTVSRERIMKAIRRLPSGDVKKLQGENGYRIRVGDYRVIFDHEGNVLMVIKIDSRGQVYK